MDEGLRKPTLSRTELVELVEDNTGAPGRLVSTALSYWAVCSDEIDALVDHADRLEAEALVGLSPRRWNEHTSSAGCPDPATSCG